MLNVPTPSRASPLPQAPLKEAIDTLLARFKGNPILGPLACQLKAQYVEGIQHQVMFNPEKNVG
jgi:hypothetical protein